VEIDLLLRADQLRELEASLQELVRGRRREREGAGVPPLELRQAAVPISVWITRMSRCARTIRVSTSSSCALSDATRRETR
jgi:hypothetical protein